MKILCENIPQSHFFRYIVNGLSHMGYPINVVQNMDNLVKALLEIKPDIILLRSESITSEVVAFADKNNAKIIAFGGQPKKCDLLVTTESIEEVDNVLFDKILANPIDVMNAEEKEHLKTKISIFTGPSTDEFLVTTLAMNYPVRIYGNKKINHPKYLGQVTQEQRNNILKSSEYIIDFGTYDFQDAILLDAYPIIYTKNETPDPIDSFSSLDTMIEQLENILDKDNTDKLSKLKEAVKHNNSLSLVQYVLDKLNFKNEAKQVEQVVEELI